MPYSHSLAARVRPLLARERGFAEKKMFGGCGFLLYGNMCVGIWHDALIARVGTEKYVESLARENVRAFDITGRPMNGWVMVDAEGLESDRELQAWVAACVGYVRTLAPKVKS